MKVMCDPKPEMIAGGPRARRDAVRDVFELVLGYGLILSVIWTPNPAQRILYWVALTAVIVITLLRRESPKSLGLTADGFLHSHCSSPPLPSRSRGDCTPCTGTSAASRLTFICRGM
jgi:hypothetical protein